MSGEYSDEEKEKILDKVYKWERKFSKSKYFRTLTDEQKQESEFVIETFADYIYSYLGTGPKEWNEEDVEECCLYILPRKITAQESYFRSVAPVLSAFFSFLAKKRLLVRGSNLAEKMKEINKEIVENASDPKNWGMAKSFTMAAMQAGFDITDEEEMEKFMALYNLSLRKSQNKPYTSEPKVGRNDPCPCGSGKKYKKCCGR